MLIMEYQSDSLGITQLLSHSHKNIRSKEYIYICKYIYQKLTDLFIYRIRPGIVEFRDGHVPSSAPKWNSQVLSFLLSVTPRHPSLSTQAASHDLGNRLSWGMDWNFVYSNDMFRYICKSELVHSDDTWSTQINIKFIPRPVRGFMAFDNVIQLHTPHWATIPRKYDLCEQMKSSPPW